jgi:hypothetical protein
MKLFHPDTMNRTNPPKIHGIRIHPPHCGLEKQIKRVLWASPFYHLILLAIRNGL